MTANINPRFDDFPENPFDRLRALLNGPQGGETVALSVGEPQHAPPKFALDLLASEQAGWAKYPPLTGTEEFAQTVLEWMIKRYALPLGAMTADQILPVAGSREPLGEIARIAFDASKPGLALIPDPAYQIYGGAAVMAGLTPLFVAASADHDFVIDYSSLPGSLLSQVRLAYFCSPANPQGKTASLAHLAAMIALARRHHFILAVDECYSEIWFDKPPAGALEAALTLPRPDSGDLFENVVIFQSLSKRSSVPGFRSGFVAGDRRVIAAFRKLRAAGGVAVPLPILKASIALWQDENHVEMNRLQYRAKFDMAEAIFGQKFDFYRPEGGFFLWLNVGDGEKAAQKLWEKAGIRVLPGAYMTSPGNEAAGKSYIRVALVHDLDVAERALRRMVEILTEEG